MLTIWLQGIWLPLHGYNFEVTPLWAGIYMIPYSIGFLISGPLSGVSIRPFGCALSGNCRHDAFRGHLRFARGFSPSTSTIRNSPG